MKYIVLICSIYLMAISVFPCNDALAKGSATFSGKQVSHVGDPHGADDKDFCSPFCTCACCSVTVNLSWGVATIQVPKPVLFETKKISLHDFNLISSYYGNIWQPPKINS